MNRTFLYLILIPLCLFLLYLSSGIIIKKNHSEYGFDHAKSVKVMTYNIRGARSADGEVNIPGIVQQIKTMDPDIIAFQEIDYRLPRTHFKNQVKLLGEQLHMNYLYAPNMNFIIGSYGSAILSKFPITDFEHTLLPSRVEKRGLLRAQINTGTQSINVYATHLGLNGEERMEQIASLTSIMAQTNGPKILLGDFNAKPTEAPIQSIRTLYLDPIYEYQLNITTYQHHKQKVQIDYIFHSSEFSFESASTKMSLISDHNPLMYSFNLNTISE